MTNNELSYLYNLMEELKQIEITHEQSIMFSTYTITLAGSDKPIKIDINQDCNLNFFGIKKPHVCNSFYYTSNDMIFGLTPPPYCVTHKTCYDCGRCYEVETVKIETTTINLK